MAFGSAQGRGRRGDAVGVELCRVGGRQLVGDDHGPGLGLAERFQRLAHQVADDAVADVAHVLDPGGDIGVVHGLEGMDDIGQGFLHGRFGVQALFLNQVLGAAHQARILQHVQIGIEQELHFAGQGVFLGLGA